MGAAAARALLADIGGTNARFALLRDDGISQVQRLRVDAYNDPADAIAAYLDQAGASPPALAVLAVAGPVEQGGARLTNAGWRFDAAALARAGGFDRVRLINDFEAQAWALPELAPDNVTPLGGGTARHDAARLVLGPGTGLGVAAYLPPTADGPERVVTGEGGHATLAAEGPDEWALLARLRARYGRVSAERVLSGPGLAALAEAVAEEQGEAVPARTPEAVLAAARDGDPTARRAEAVFCGLLGAFAGDLALIFGARGGVWLGGGLTAALAAELPGSTFRARFEAKGRFRDYVADIPVWIVRHPEPALLGLASQARALGASRPSGGAGKEVG